MDHAKLLSFASRQSLFETSVAANDPVPVASLRQVVSDADIERLESILRPSEQVVIEFSDAVSNTTFKPTVLWGIVYLLTQVRVAGSSPTHTATDV